MPSEPRDFGLELQVGCWTRLRAFFLPVNTSELALLLSLMQHLLELFTVSVLLTVAT